MVIKTVDEVREYIQKDYWESGKEKGVSGYSSFHIDWNWNNRLVSALEQVYDFRDKEIIDLGCAYGQVVAAFLKKGYSAYGIDISDYAIKAGHKEYTPLTSRTIQGSVHNLSSYESETFDFLYSNQVFEHVPADVCEELAKETFRVANDGAVLWAGLVLDLSEAFQPQGYNPEDPDKTHINLRPRKWWDEKMKAAGWKTNYDFDRKFRQHKLNDGYSFFEDYGWHTICYRKE